MKKYTIFKQYADETWGIVHETDDYDEARKELAYWTENSDLFEKVRLVENLSEMPGQYAS
jgi:hypothetical protein